MKYSIWVAIPDPLHAELQNIISSLAKKYSCPKFEPHMTLLGEIDADQAVVIENTKKLAKTVGQLKLSLGPVSFSTTYFQSVFVRVDSTPQLMSLNLEAKNLFSMKNDVFMPHISLLYSKPDDMNLREKVAQEVPSLNRSFTANDLVVVAGEGDPKNWKIIQVIPFEE